jgi:predicted amidophosphoribosyltransferase
MRAEQRVVASPPVVGELTAAEFPDCLRCAYYRTGPVARCVGCAGRALTLPARDTCVVCAQRLRPDGGCPNELCHSPRRRISKIHVIGYQVGALRRAINAYKYRGSRGLAVVFGRLLLGWLEEHASAGPPGLIVVNPSFVGAGGQQFAHTEAVLAAAAAEDRAGRWPFDAGAIVKTQSTLRSADAQAWSKKVSGSELRDVLRVADPARTAGQSVLVYDDVCTTGTQLDAVAGCLLDKGGAARVEGIVLARAPWRGG